MLVWAKALNSASLCVWKTMCTGKAATPLGVSVKTLQRWEREWRRVPIAPL